VQVSFRWSWQGGSSPLFSTRQQAEDWMGEVWRSLLDGGVQEASLEQDGQLLYSMRLSSD
jgi:hypothetical protein